MSTADIALQEIIEGKLPFERVDEGELAQTE
jgi:DNA-directed RNA polymerase subunit K/omega